MIYKVSYDGASWGPGKKYVHIGAIIEVEAESEEGAKRIALNKLRKGQYDRINVLLHGDFRRLLKERGGGAGQES